MAKSHPYISGPGNIKEIIQKLRSNFPNTVTSETIKQIGLAPKNESHIINALQFIGLIDADGKKDTEKAKAFLYQKDEEFQDAFSKIIKDAYEELFKVHGDNAWTLDTSGLTTFFRQTDQTSETIGRRQASVFEVFSSLSGKIEERASLGRTGQKIQKRRMPKATKANLEKEKKNRPDSKSSSPFDHLGMSIKIEVNLPSAASEETYDNIFKSIRKHILNG